MTALTNLTKNAWFGALLLCPVIFATQSLGLETVALGMFAAWLLAAAAGLLGMLALGACVLVRGA